MNLKQIIIERGMTKEQQELLFCFSKFDMTEDEMVDHTYRLADIMYHLGDQVPAYVNSLAEHKDIFKDPMILNIIISYFKTRNMKKGEFSAIFNLENTLKISEFAEQFLSIGPNTHYYDAIRFNLNSKLLRSPIVILKLDPKFLSNVDIVSFLNTKFDQGENIEKVITVLNAYASVVNLDIKELLPQLTSEKISADDKILQKLAWFQIKAVGNVSGWAGVHNLNSVWFQSATTEFAKKVSPKIISPNGFKYVLEHLLPENLNEDRIRALNNLVDLFVEDTNAIDQWQYLEACFFKENKDHHVLLDKLSGFVAWVTPRHRAFNYASLRRILVNFLLNDDAYFKLDGLGFDSLVKVLHKFDPIFYSKDGEVLYKRLKKLGIPLTDDYIAVLNKILVKFKDPSQISILNNLQDAWLDKVALEKLDQLDALKFFNADGLKFISFFNPILLELKTIGLLNTTPEDQFNALLKTIPENQLNKEQVLLVHLQPFNISEATKENYVPMFASLAQEVGYDEILAYLDSLAENKDIFRDPVVVMVIVNYACSRDFKKIKFSDIFNLKITQKISEYADKFPINEASKTAAYFDAIRFNLNPILLNSSFILKLNPDLLSNPEVISFLNIKFSQRENIEKVIAVLNAYASAANLNLKELLATLNSEKISTDYEILQKLEWFQIKAPGNVSDWVDVHALNPVWLKPIVANFAKKADVKIISPNGIKYVLKHLSPENLSEDRIKALNNLVNLFVDNANDEQQWKSLEQGFFVIKHPEQSLDIISNFLCSIVREDLTLDIIRRVINFILNQGEDLYRRLKKSEILLTSSYIKLLNDALIKISDPTKFGALNELSGDWLWEEGLNKLNQLDAQKFLNNRGLVFLMSFNPILLGEKEIALLNGADISYSENDGEERLSHRGLLLKFERLKLIKEYVASSSTLQQKREISSLPVPKEDEIPLSPKMKLANSLNSDECFITSEKLISNQRSANALITFSDNLNYESLNDVLCLIKTDNNSKNTFYVPCSRNAANDAIAKQLPHFYDADRPEKLNKNDIIDLAPENLDIKLIFEHFIQETLSISDFAEYLKSSEYLTGVPMVFFQGKLDLLQQLYIFYLKNNFLFTYLTLVVNDSVTTEDISKLNLAAVALFERFGRDPKNVKFIENLPAKYFKIKEFAPSDFAKFPDPSKGVKDAFSYRMFCEFSEYIKPIHFQQGLTMKDYIDHFTLAVNLCESAKSMSNDEFEQLTTGLNILDILNAHRDTPDFNALFLPVAKFLLPKLNSIVGENHDYDNLIKKLYHYGCLNHEVFSDDLQDFLRKKTKSIINEPTGILAQATSDKFQSFIALKNAAELIVRGLLFELKGHYKDAIFSNLPIYYHKDAVAFYDAIFKFSGVDPLQPDSIGKIAQLDTTLNDIMNILQAKGNEKFKFYAVDFSQKFKSFLDTDFLSLAAKIEDPDVLTVCLLDDLFYALLTPVFLELYAKNDKISKRFFEVLETYRPAELIKLLNENESIKTNYNSYKGIVVPNESKTEMTLGSTQAANNSKSSTNKDIEKTTVPKKSASQPNGSDTSQKNTSGFMNGSWFTGNSVQVLKHYERNTWEYTLADNDLNAGLIILRTLPKARDIVFLPQSRIELGGSASGIDSVIYATQYNMDRIVYTIMQVHGNHWISVFAFTPKHGPTQILLIDPKFTDKYKRKDSEEFKSKFKRRFEQSANRDNIINEKIVIKYSNKFEIDAPMVTQQFNGTDCGISCLQNGKDLIQKEIVTIVKGKMVFHREKLTLDGEQFIGKEKQFDNILVDVRADWENQLAEYKGKNLIFYFYDMHDEPYGNYKFENNKQLLQAQQNVLDIVDETVALFIKNNEQAITTSLKAQANVASLPDFRALYTDIIDPFLTSIDLQAYDQAVDKLLGLNNADEDVYKISKEYLRNKLELHIRRTFLSSGSILFVEKFLDHLYGLKVIDNQREIKLPLNNLREIYDAYSSEDPVIRQWINFFKQDARFYEYVEKCVTAHVKEINQKLARGNFGNFAANLHPSTKPTPSSATTTIPPNTAAMTLPPLASSSAVSMPSSSTTFFEPKRTHPAGGQVANKSNVVDLLDILVAKLRDIPGSLPLVNATHYFKALPVTTALKGFVMSRLNHDKRVQPLILDCERWKSWLDNQHDESQINQQISFIVKYFYELMRSDVNFLSGDYEWAQDSLSDTLLHTTAKLLEQQLAKQGISSKDRHANLNQIGTARRKFDEQCHINSEASVDLTVGYVPPTPQNP